MTADRRFRQPAPSELRAGVACERGHVRVVLTARTVRALERQERGWRCPTCRGGAAWLPFGQREDRR